LKEKAKCGITSTQPDAALIRWSRDHLPHREKLPP
jgi:hypothetical protein